MKSLCETCGNDMLVSKYKKSIGRGRFCSSKCYGIWYSNNRKGINSVMYRRVKQNCLTCGKEFYAIRAKLRNGGGKFCSRKCSAIFRGRNITGESHPRWKGGKTVEAKCKTCGNTFLALRQNVRVGWGKFCSQSCRSISILKNFPNKETKIENKLRMCLSENGIKFVPEYVITNPKTIVDFFVYPNICVYADGDYWHNREKAKIRDVKINKELKLNGFVVLRFWEHEINKNIIKCIDKIKEAINENQTAKVKVGVRQIVESGDKEEIQTVCNVR